MSNQAVADARLGLLYHCVWEKRVADATFARWSREDFVTLAGVAEAIHAYDRTPNPHPNGVDRVVGISQVLHQWMAQEQNFRRDHGRWLREGSGTGEPKNPLHQHVSPTADADGSPMWHYRRLAGAILREGRFAQVVAPGTPWIAHTEPQQLHYVLRIDETRRGAIAERSRSQQLAVGAREARAAAAHDQSINWAPIEAQISQQVAPRYQPLGA